MHLEPHRHYQMDQLELAGWLAGCGTSRAFEWFSLPFPVMGSKLSTFGEVINFSDRYCRAIDHDPTSGCSESISARRVNPSAIY